MPKGKRVEHRSAVTRDEAANMLRALARGVRHGEFRVPAEAGEVSFHPRGDLQLAINLSATAHSGALDMELRWTYVPSEEDVTR